MKLLITAMLLILFSFSTAFSQLIDSFSDGDFTSNPAWVGDTDHWEIVTNSISGPNTSNSFTLRIAAPSRTPTDATDYLSVQHTGEWGSEQTWGFWFGRTSGSSPSLSNQSIIWLYASGANTDSGNVDGYRILIGQTSADPIKLQRVDNGVPTTFLTSAESIPGIDDYSVLVRVIRNAASEWTIFTSVLPITNGDGPSPLEIPDASNTTINQGTATDATYTSFSNGYMGFGSIHTDSDAARSGAEFDQFYFEPTADAALPVELLNFNSRPAGNSIRLQWATASEIDNLGFILERAEAADGPFRTIACYQDEPALRGALNSSATLEYQYNDAAVFRNQHYWYRLSDVDINGTQTVQATVQAFLPMDAADTDDARTLPGEFTLGNYPNPFNPSTTVYFDISFFRDRQIVTDLSVFNLLGQRVSTIFHGELSPARYAFRWAGTDDYGRSVPAGIYLCRLNSADRFLTKRLILLK
jgi:hypothetical protein